ncbi:unnamed protein product, partial [marine sediment metagenome]
GDLVKSFDVKNQKLVNSKVIKVFCHSCEEMGEYYLVINDNIRVTPNHPFYVNDKWLPAGEIKTGDLLLNINGDAVRVVSVQKIFEQHRTFNLEVEGCHNYFAEDVLVHNKQQTCSNTCPNTCSSTCSTCNTNCGQSTCNCFIAGTKITMADGSLKNIEDVEIGDFVKTFNETANEIVDGR